MKISLAIDIIQTLACLYILKVGLHSLNRMTCATSHRIRFTFVLLSVGALCYILWIWQPCGPISEYVDGLDMYDLFNTLWILSVTVYVAVTQCQRRKSTFHGCERRG